ncbi:MAG TPA: tripartite tricarboxylate transporter substrate binding protein [Burkholderiales bacterium]|nr:tripartite tricarboxylate transporter substrate binding protein [Burkholderiales bacterium]
MKRTMVALALALILPVAASAQTQKYPTKPVRMIVPFVPGGASDILARLLSVSLKEQWGQPVIVENKTGAGGTIGTDAVAKAPPDGYTLMVSDLGTMTIIPSLMKKMPYDLHKDLAPVTVLTYSPYLIVVTPSLPPKSLKELVEYSKANPGKLNYATPGLGSNVHLAGLQFATALGIEWTYIPSKGGAQAMQDVAGGHADLIFNSMLATAPHVKSGSLRLLGVTSPKRVPAYPDTPTAGELVRGYTAGSWQGVLTTAGTPKEVVAKINADIVKLLNTPAMKAKIVDLGAEPIGNPPAEMDRFLREDRARWAKLIQETGLKLEQ